MSIPIESASNDTTETVDVQNKFSPSVITTTTDDTTGWTNGSFTTQPAIYNEHIYSGDKDFDHLISRLQYINNKQEKSFILIITIEEVIIQIFKIENQHGFNCNGMLVYDNELLNANEFINILKLKNRYLEVLSALEGSVLGSL